VHDLPKILGDPAVVQSRLSQVHEAHIFPLTHFVERLRFDKGDNRIPYFDPWDGGVGAEILFLLEAPGPKAKIFVSRNNPDETAKNIFELTMEAGISRKRCVNWNVVPWPCQNADGTNRNPTNAEVREGVDSLGELFNLLPKVNKVVLLGQKAQRAERHIRQLRSDLEVFLTRHPSAMSLNRNPGNREELLTALMAVVG
jgi:hypothetical protein